ncbi:PTS sugar transporter subunit IIA, partial [bacterium]|nr:PTS sugar transporter subunit IIA [bacterium]
MKQVINHLIQVQELRFALAEQTTANPKAPVEKLKAAIDKLLAELPAEIAQRYQTLQGRFPLAVVPLARGICSGCGLSVPHATINDLQAARQVHPCPHCGRFLYWHEPPPSSPAAAVRQKGPPRPGISRFSSVDLMLPRVQAKTKEDAVAELAATMERHEFIGDAGVIAQRALDREAMISTAVEYSLAFPHVRNLASGSLTLSLGLKPAGIEWGAPNGKLTRIIFLIVIPTAASAFYLKLLAGLVRTFSEKD